MKEDRKHEKTWTYLKQAHEKRCWRFVSQYFLSLPTAERWGVIWNFFIYTINVRFESSLIGNKAAQNENNEIMEMK